MTPRELAEIDVRAIRTELAAAETRLRAAVKAEIAAMPAVAGANGFAAVYAAASVHLRENDGSRAMNARPQAKRTIPRERKAGWLMDMDGDDMGAICSLQQQGKQVVVAIECQREQCWFAVPKETMDAAVKGALLWLADRGVFPPARAP